jgi:hypothetical protein
MKKVFVAALLLASTSASFGQEYATTFNITGGIGINGDDFRTLELDVGFMNRYLEAHGTLDDASGLSVPVTGTCFAKSGGGIFCNVSAGYITLVIDLGNNLSGTARMVNTAGGTVVDSAALTLSNIK